jgi:hypothetical protein
LSYFISGLWHFAAAMAFALAFGVFHAGEPTFWLRIPAFDATLIMASCAFFPVPDRWAKKGALKFLHYPWPDWDVLLLGPASHRNWLSHSPLVPFALLVLASKYPNLMEWEPLVAASVGLCVGLGSHLFWDCVGSKRHKIVVVPYWFALREAASRLWLLLGALICLSAASAFANWQKLGL